MQKEVMALCLRVQFFLANPVYFNNRKHHLTQKKIIKMHAYLTKLCMRIYFNIRKTPTLNKKINMHAYMINMHRITLNRQKMVLHTIFCLISLENKQNRSL